MALRIRVLSFLIITINAMQSLGQAPNATAKEIGKFYLMLEDLSQATQILFIRLNEYSISIYNRYFIE